MTIISVSVLSGCCISHDYAEATCTCPPTCKKCGKTNGEPLGHDYIEATCTSAKQCKICGEECGEPLGHDLCIDEAIFATPESEGLTQGVHCKRCGEVLTPQKKTQLETDAEIKYYDALQLFEEKNYSDGFNLLYYSLKDSGLADANAYLGLCYYNSLGTAEDNDKAYQYFSMAAEKTNPIGLYGKAQCLRFGYGVEADEKEAAKLFSEFIEAADNQYGTCKYKTERDYFTFLEGFVLLHGCTGSCDYEGALECFEKSGESGCAEACLYAGMMSYQGLGIQKNDKTALKWFEKAYEGEDERAGVCLYSMYLLGIGCDKDIQKAEQIKEEALDNGTVNSLFGKSCYILTIYPGEGTKYSRLME